MISLALGIGSATAVFSVVYGVVLDPFPYKDVRSLMSIQVSEPGQRGGRVYYTVDQFLAIRDSTSLFDGVTASTISDLFWTDGPAAERLRGNHTTYDGLEVMGVPALIGRIFTRADRGNNVCVLGFRFWQRQFTGDPNVLGKTLLLNGKARTIVGVMPPRFMWRGADVYVPLDLRRGVVDEDVQFVHVVGRMKPGVTPARAEAELRPVIDEMRRQAPASFPARYRVRLLSFADTFPSGISDVLWALFAAVGLLLLISCANVSNLLFAHSFHRAREMAVRISLGATRRGLIRQLLTESAFVALSGGALGVALAWVGMKGILAMVPAQTIPDEAEVSLNWPVLAFAVGVSMITTILFGLLPALQSARKDVVEPLKSGGRAGTTRRESWISGGLVVTEVGLSLMLLTAAALMVRSLIRVTSAEYGVETSGVLTSRIPMDPRRYAEPERRAAFATQLLDRLKSNPAIQNAALNTGYHPFGNSSMPVVVLGISDKRRIIVHSISSDYARVFHIPVHRGRFPDETDVRARRQVAAVSESFVRRYFSGREPIGGTFRAPRLSEQPFRLTSTVFEIVGVVGDTRTYDAKEVIPEAYIPFTLSGPANFAIVMRPKAGDPRALVPLLRAAIAELDKDQPVMDTEPVDYFIARYVSAGPKFSVVLFGAFGFLGLVLVAVGIYGVIANAVARRTREIGLRMAVGATMADVMRMVIERGVRLIALGVVVGVAGGLAAAGYLQTLLHGGTPYDPVSVAAVVAVLAITGIVASWLPARRAARIAPMDALRVE